MIYCFAHWDAPRYGFKLCGLIGINYITTYYYEIADWS
jgi:hypothetical protein